MKLLKQRLSQGFTRLELAKRSKVDWKTIFNIEKGKFIPRLSTISRLSEALKVDPKSIKEFKIRIDRSNRDRVIRKLEKQLKEETIVTLLTRDINKIKVAYPGLGLKIRRLRLEKKLSQEKLAETLNISWMSIHRWERDERGIKYPMLVQLADLFEVTISYLLTYEED